MSQESGRGTEGMVCLYSIESEVWNHWKVIHSHIWQLTPAVGSPCGSHPMVSVRGLVWVPPSMVPGILGLEFQKRETSGSWILLWPSPGGHTASPPSCFTAWCHRKPSPRFVAGVGGINPPLRGGVSITLWEVHVEWDLV